MKLIFISDNGCHHRKINISWRVIALGLLFIFLTSFAITSAFSSYNKSAISDNEIAFINKFDSILLKAAKLEGQVKRLNSLGKVIANKQKIDTEAYLLKEFPAMGGIDGQPRTGVFATPVVTQTSLSRSIDDLELELELQEQRFNKMKLNQETPKPIKAVQVLKPSAIPISTVPSYSIPVLTGYISSTFGKRRDPINGHQRHHNGIDIAAKHGSKIHTIASGFVTFSGRKSGYGNVVDIHHSDTLKSRYAHLDTIRVKKGEVVRKGDTIATMGQTGRATGSHLHLEVWEKNRPVNPESYIDTALIK